MAYTLTIEREDAVISLEEWLAAVEATDGIRKCQGGRHTATNPLTGAIMSMAVEPGDVEIYDLEAGQWKFCIRWYGGSPSFNANVIARALDGDLSDPAWIALHAVVARLQASIVGEEGEAYGDNGLATR